MGKKSRRERKQHDDEEITEETDTRKTEKSLYEILGVEPTASQEEIKKAYHRLALRLHPDKNPGDQNAKEKFQALQSVIAILGDSETRKVYDQTGSLEDAELSGERTQDLYEYFRTLYKKVTEEEIEKFASSYRGSVEEEKDLKELFVKCKGDMNRVFNMLMCSDSKLDSHRFKDIFDSAIASGELKERKIYRTWAADVAKQPVPSNPLKLASKRKSKEEPASDLITLISSRGKQRMESCFSALEAKYANNGKNSRGRLEEPTDEEFEAAQRRLEKKANEKKKGSKR
ncbi:hypothetical protein O6H91_12G053300 [Diphasiastrum complanatum]|uniref:Uncharacterized protein n=1 Tax=Diphasiastrum complanatum TaxID=34168 RepID=A0ACC2C2F7_DIPCM|nr:hypothetical protein O6H91_12G053300 [Diphasiastrum complanatum]